LPSATAQTTTATVSVWSVRTGNSSQMIIMCVSPPLTIVLNKKAQGCAITAKLTMWKSMAFAVNQYRTVKYTVIIAVAPKSAWMVMSKATTATMKTKCASKKFLTAKIKMTLGSACLVTKISRFVLITKKCAFKNYKSTVRTTTAMEAAKHVILTTP